MIYNVVAKRKREEVKKMEKYRELVELKGLLRQKKITYETLAKYLIAFCFTTFAFIKI